MFTWMQRLEQRVGVYDHDATEIIVNDQLEDISYIFELERRANELVLDGSIFETTIIDNEAPYFVAWYDRG